MKPHQDMNAIIAALREAAEVSNFFVFKIFGDQLEGDYAVMQNKNYTFAGGRIDKNVYDKIMGSGILVPTKQGINEGYRIK